MRAKEMWALSGFRGTYTAWAFGDAPDALAELVKEGKKTGTSSTYDLYGGAVGEPLPKAGEYSVILDDHGEAVCIIRTTNVYVTLFDQVTAEHARREGEGDLSLEYWRKVHREFFRKEMEAAGLTFSEKMNVVCEEFVKVYPQ